MKFVANEVNVGKEILANNDWAGMPHKFTADAKAGDVVDGLGVCLYDVDVEKNPNGTVVYRGVIDMRKLESSQYPSSAQMTKLPQLIWMNEDNTHYAG